MPAKYGQYSGKPDEVFFEDLKIGYYFQQLVARDLQLCGFDIHMDPLQIRPERKDASKYYDHGDITVILRKRKVKIEVKSKPYEFKGIRDFPYPEVVISDKHIFDRKIKQQGIHAVVIVSQITGKMFAIRVSLKKYWLVKEITNERNKTTTDHYVIPKNLATTMDQFIKWMKLYT